MCAQREEDFQRSKILGVIKRQEFILETGFLSDCRFLVGTFTKKLFPCHKFVLGLASPVFERMFYGGLPEVSDPICLPDVDPDAFNILLRYAYTDECKISADLLIKANEIYYVGQKYLMTDFIERFLSFLQFTPFVLEHIIPIYIFSIFVSNSDLTEKCERAIKTNACDLITHETFHHLEIPEVKKICQIVMDHVTPLQMFDAIGNYALTNCLLEDDSTITESKIKDCSNSMEDEGAAAYVQDSDKNVPNITDLVALVNFNEINAKDFAQGPAKSALLKPEEALEILSRLVINQEPNTETSKKLPLENCWPEAFKNNTNRFNFSKNSRRPHTGDKRDLS